MSEKTSMPQKKSSKQQSEDKINQEYKHQLDTAIEHFRSKYFRDTDSDNPFLSLVQKGHEAFSELLPVLDLQGDEHSSARIQALLVIGNIFDQFGLESETLDTLVEYSKKLPHSGNEKVAVLRAIGKSKQPYLIAGFTSLLDKPVPEVVNSALIVLGYAKYIPALPAIKWVITQENILTAPAAVWAIGEIGDNTGLDILIEAYKNNKYIHDVILAMGKIGDRQGLAYLCMTLRDSGDSALRYHAALGIFNTVVKNQDQKFDSLFPFLENSLQDIFPPIRAVSLTILGLLGKTLTKTQIAEVFEIQSHIKDEDITDMAKFFMRRN